MKYFPKTPYEHQKFLVERIEEALRDGKIVLFEGACGTGKTLVSLASALSAAEDLNKKVIIATSVHQQMNQFVEELKEIKRRVEDLRVTVLKGKSHLCPENRSYEECEKMRKGEENLFCERYLKSSERRVLEFEEWYFSDVRYPEEVLEREEDCCVYELLKRCMETSDLLLCNYHHVLDLEIFTRVMNWFSCTPEDLIIIFDEAHNLESASREHGSMFLERKILKKAIEELREGRKEDYAEFLRRFEISLEKMIEERWADMRGEDAHREILLGDEEILERLRELHENPVELFEELYEISFEGHENVGALSEFMLRYFEVFRNPSYATFINLRENGDYTLEIFSCIPKDVMRPLFDSIFSSILMSATLRPFQIIKEVLGIERETVEIVSPSPFPKERRLTLSVRFPPLFQKRREDERTVRLLRSALRDIIRFSSGNVLIFFPNYQEAERYYRMMDIENKLLDRVGESSEEIRRRFFELGERGKKAVLFTYLWGTLSEGVDYRDGRARTVVIVGVGYPSLSERMMTIKRAYDHRFGNGFEYAIQTPTIRRIRQCMGRVVRSPEDYGVRILLDVRFTRSALRTLPKYEVYSKFPEDEREEFIEISPEEIAERLSKFFSGFFHSASEFRTLI
ncbi:MAG: ATP-dependent DNA helicase [Archaeoglobi archaeon]|nr:ATP-dependent DNA helicase [Candidatus Mnemosynella sp.]